MDPVRSPRGAQGKNALILIGAAVIGIVFGFARIYDVGPSKILENWSADDIIVILFYAVLLCFVPYALRVSEEFSLPGAILLRARPDHQQEEQPTARSTGRIVKWGLLGAGILLLAHFIWSFAAYLAGQRPPQNGLTPSELQFLRAQASRPTGQLVIAALLSSVGAAISEEIVFRLVLTAIIARAAYIALSGMGRRWPRGALWSSIFIQAYLFGLVHWLSGGGSSLRDALIHGAASSEMVGGLIFGIIYLEQGIETAVVSHALLDTIIAVMRIVMLRLSAGLLERS